MSTYERFVGELSRSELEGFFLLDGTALDLIAHKRADHHKIGMGLQVGTVRFLGHFLTEDPLDVPWSAVEYVADQLEITDPSVVKRYTERQQTAYEHSWEIRAAYGYRDFGRRAGFAQGPAATGEVGGGEGVMPMDVYVGVHVRREPGDVGIEPPSST